MRAIGCLLLVLGAGDAAADKKIQDLTPGYQREHTACVSQTAGMQKIANGVSALAKTADEAERAELDKAAAALAKGTAVFEAYCTELGGLVAFLEAQADAPYRTVEREIDQRATKTSRLRRDAKKQTEELAPLTRKMIPRIMAARTPAAEPEKRVVVKFPSGRSVELPVGTWRATSSATGDVAETEDKGVVIRLSTRLLEGSCEQHRPKAGTELEAKPAVWAVRYVQEETSGAHAVVMACVAKGDKSVVATGDVAPPKEGLEVVKMVLKMAAAFP